MPKVIIGEYTDIEIGTNRNQQIVKKLDTWNRTETFLKNDEDEILKKFMVKLPNESDVAFDKRKKYFVQTFINTANDLLTAPVNSIFAQNIKLTFENENSMLKSFSENVTRANDRITFLEWLKTYVALNLRAYGNVITLVTKPKIQAKNREEERFLGLPYLKNIRCQDIVNWQIIDGRFIWFSYKSSYQKPWLNPISEEYPESKLVEYIWTPSELIVRDKDKSIIPELSFVHNYGFVPIIVQASFLCDSDNIIGSAAFDNTANMLVTFNNLIHTAVHELYKHGGALLLRHDESIVAQSRRVDSMGNTEIKKQDNDSTLEWGGENKPEYLVKDLQVERMKEMALFYLQQAILNERDLKSVTKIGETGAIQNQSGISKMVDREPMEASLNSLAVDLEHYTNKVYEMVADMLLVEDDHVFNIDKDFDLKTLSDKYNDIILASKANLNQLAPTLYKEQIKAIVPSLVSDIDKQNQIYEEIDTIEGEEASLLEMFKNENKDEEETENENEKAAF